MLSVPMIDIDTSRPYPVGVVTARPPPMATTSRKPASGPQATLPGTLCGRTCSTSVHDHSVAICAEHCCGTCRVGVCRPSFRRACAGESLWSGLPSFSRPVPGSCSGGRCAHGLNASVTETAVASQVNFRRRDGRVSIFVSLRHRTRREDRTCGTHCCALLCHPPLA